MNVLITGPSCAGKTTYCRGLEGCRRVELDLVPSVRDLDLATGSSQRNLFDGLPSGSDGDIARFASCMDRIFLLDTPFEERLCRIVHKDGPLAFGCFLYNEYAWVTYLQPVLEPLPQTRILAPAELPPDPFSPG